MRIFVLMANYDLGVSRKSHFRDHPTRYQLIDVFFCGLSTNNGWPTEVSNGPCKLFCQYEAVFFGSLADIMALYIVSYLASVFPYCKIQDIVDWICAEKGGKKYLSKLREYRLLESLPISKQAGIFQTEHTVFRHFS
jgi:hypothetical protein